jgi:hypothetical protein
VGARADLRGAAHGVLLVRVLDQAHLVQHGAQVALLLGAQARHSARGRAPVAASRPRAVSSPWWVANGYQTASRFSSSLGSSASSSATGAPRPHPALRGGFVRAQAQPSQISRSRSLGWQNSVLRPSPVITSQALGSAKPVR